MSFPFRYRVQASAARSVCSHRQSKSIRSLLRAHALLLPCHCGRSHHTVSRSRSHSTPLPRTSSRQRRSRAVALSPRRESQAPVSGRRGGHHDTLTAGPARHWRPLPVPPRQNGSGRHARGLDAKTASVFGIRPEARPAASTGLLPRARHVQRQYRGGPTPTHRLRARMQCVCVCFF